jgi:hypothetical protein
MKPCDCDIFGEASLPEHLEKTHPRPFLKTTMNRRGRSKFLRNRISLATRAQDIKYAAEDQPIISPLSPAAWLALILVLWIALRQRNERL